MPNQNESMFIAIFSLLAIIIVLTTYVCWLKRIKMNAKREILYDQHQLERTQQLQQMSGTQLQQMKPVLLQQLYDQDVQRQRHYHNEQVPQYTPQANHSQDVLVTINDESERDATIIHSAAAPPRTVQPPLKNPFEG